MKGGLSSLTPLLSRGPGGDLPPDPLRLLPGGRRARPLRRRGAQSSSNIPPARQLYSARASRETPPETAEFSPAAWLLEPPVTEVYGPSAMLALPAVIEE